MGKLGGLCFYGTSFNTFPFSETPDETRYGFLEVSTQANNYMPREESIRKPTRKKRRKTVSRPTPKLVPTAVADHKVVCP